MTEFTLKPQEKKTLKLNIGDKSFHIPLGGSLTPAEAATLDTFKGTREFYNQYLDQEVIDVLTIDDYNAITKAWREASRGDKTPGES